MKENKVPRLLFDYAQAESKECRKGNLIHSYYLSKDLSRRFTLFGIRPNSDPSIISKETGVRFFTNFFLNIRLRSIVHLAHFISAIFNNRKIDLVYSRYGYSWKQFGLIFKILFRKPFILEVDGVPWEEETGLRYSQFFIKLLRYPLIKADKLIFISNATRAEFQRVYPDLDSNSVVIGTGVDETRFVIKDRDSLRIKYEINQKDFIISFVGVIERWQGLSILIEACKKMTQDKIDYKFLIVGGGRYIEQIQKLVRENTLDEYFVFTGYVQPDRVVDYINLADVCIAPFVKNRKASPIKIFEYMACGKMVIVPEISDVVDLNIPKGLLLYEAENPNSLFQVLKDILEGDGEKIHAPDAIRELIIQKYTWTQVAAEVSREISKLMGP